MLVDCKKVKHEIPEINLLAPKKKSAIDKITYFSLHYLRYILVITQFVTICVFFYRFKIDQDIVDSRDLLMQKQSIVDATQTLLAKVEELDFKIKNVNTVFASQESFTALSSYLFQTLPSDISIVSLSINSGSITMKGTASNVDVIRTFYETLQQEDKFEKVTLENINKTEDGFDFNLELSNFGKEANGQEENP